METKEDCKKGWMGIDIGKAGCVVIIFENSDLIIPVPKVKNVVDLDGLMRSLMSIKDHINHCVFEDLSSVYGASAKANFQFGKICGVIEAFVRAANIPFTKVRPMTWQKEMWMGVEKVVITSPGKSKPKVDTKATSLLAAQQLFPGKSFLRTERSRVADHNVVDAYLMAEYCRRRFK